MDLGFSYLFTVYYLLFTPLLNFILLSNSHLLPLSLSFLFRILDLRPCFINVSFANEWKMEVCFKSAEERRGEGRVDDGWMDDGR